MPNINRKDLENSKTKDYLALLLNEIDVSNFVDGSTQRSVKLGAPPADIDIPDIGKAAAPAPPPMPTAANPPTPPTPIGGTPGNVPDPTLSLIHI